MGRGTAPLQTSPQAPGNPEREWGRMHIQDVREKTFYTRGGCFVGFFCDRCYNGTAPIIIDLCSLEEEVRHTGIDRGHVGI